MYSFYFTLPGRNIYGYKISALSLFLFIASFRSDMISNKKSDNKWDYFSTLWDSDQCGPLVFYASPCWVYFLSYLPPWSWKEQSVDKTVKEKKVHLWDYSCFSLLLTLRKMYIFHRLGSSYFSLFSRLLKFLPKSSIYANL